MHLVAGCHSVHVPIEQILTLAASLADHLLAYQPSKGASSPPRKQRASKAAASAATSRAARSGRSTGSSTTASTTGKRRKAQAVSDAGAGSSAPDPAVTSDEVSGAAEGEVLVQEHEESATSWEALLGGLAEVCAGIGLLVDKELCKYVEKASRVVGWCRARNFSVHTSSAIAVSVTCPLQFAA